MDVNILYAAALCQLQQRIQMLVVAVDAAVGEQADEMQCLTVRRSVLYCAQQGRIFKKAAVLDVFGDASELLIHDTACADVRVAHLAVAHLAVW